MLRKRFFSTQTPPSSFTLNPKPQNTNIRRPNWAITQVTKSNFTNSVTKLKNLISDSDYIAVSLQKTGTYSSPWHRILPFDTAETAYLKAKYAAEKFQIFQLAVCPFSVVRGSTNKIIAHPFNFHLFPRDELKIGMPCYSFSCQPSYLASMAREDFDFNFCIYDGISYLSRAQESAAKRQIGNPVSSGYVPQSPSSRSVADNVFVERIKSRIGNWINACKRSDTKTDDALVNSLRKLILGGEDYGSRPSLNIDVCSERQVQLVFEMVKSHYDNVVPLTISLKGGGTQAVRVVLTSSKEDRYLLENELQDVEEEQSKRVRGFREVIDLISTSQKPVIAHNSLNEFTVIHSKFLSPLPPTMDEFKSSLHSAFPNIIDVDHLMKGIGPLNKYTNLTAAISYLKKHFFAPIEIEIPHEASMEESKNHGHNVVRISELFAKLCFIQKITPQTELQNPNGPSTLKQYSNVFSLDSNDFQGSSETDDISLWTQNPKKISINTLVFLWGFRSGISAGKLKNLLCKSHDMLSEDHVFDVWLVDKSCAVVVFWKNGVSEWFLNAINSGDGLGELVADGMMAAGYEAYKKVCRSEILGMDLADSLGEIDTVSGDHKEESAEVYWNSELMINFDDL
ncbi:polynucleotidyl transferase, ribonuclease H-like superfamily protein [Artemisia annua]|uniref:Polynucleotidyl transferase, ribonuclease H-like superfamily protein n=1 Tax=Artemisia annua TaxID=35608 RepID=A0A2U1M3C5_ARTAN|nr:polynucleotidyl transferase, ribonuclease H-like superfamily protein [Artemisia annua]